MLVVPAGGETLALRVFNLLHYGHHAQVNALCLILLLLAVLPLVAWALFRLLKKPAHVLAGRLQKVDSSVYLVAMQ